MGFNKRSRKIPTERILPWGIYWTWISWIVCITKECDMKTIKLTTFNDLRDCDRQDVNDLIAALVRMGYEVWMTDTFVCFNLGNDDEADDAKIYKEK